MSYFELSKELFVKIAGLIDQGVLFDENKAYQKAIDLYYQAWDLLPAPKQKWNFSVVIAQSLFHSCFHQKIIKKQKNG